MPRAGGPFYIKTLLAVNLLILSTAPARPLESINRIRATVAPGYNPTLLRTCRLRREFVFNFVSNTLGFFILLLNLVDRRQVCTRHPIPHSTLPHPHGTLR